MPVATITKPTGGATGSNMTSPIFSYLNAKEAAKRVRKADSLRTEVRGE